MESRDLEFFVTVAEELHFARAAARLRIVPAAVSQRVRDLEQELGVQLFERTSRRVALTSAGERLLEPARVVLRGMSAVTELAGSLKNGSRGTLRINFAPNLGSFATAVVSGLVARLPNLDILGTTMWGEEAMSSVQRGDAVAAIVRAPIEASDLVSLRIGSYHDGFVAVPATEDLTGQDAISVRSFEGRPFLVSERSLTADIHDRTVTLFADHGVAPVWKHHRMQDYEQEMAFVAAGYGATLVHSHQASVRYPGVAIRPLLEEAPVYDVVVVHRSRDHSAIAATVSSVASVLASPNGRNPV